MKIKITNASVLGALNALVKVTGAVHATAAAVKRKKKDVLALSATGNGKSIRLYLADVEMEKAGQFSFNINVMLGVLKGRKETVLEYDEEGNSVSFSAANAKGYKGSFVILPFDEIEVVPEGYSDWMELNDEYRKSLESAIKKVSVNNLYTNEAMYLFVRRGKNGLEVVCYDQFHLAHYHNPELSSKEEGTFSIPVDTFDVISGQAKGSDFLLSISESVIYAANDSFEIKLPLIQNEQKQSFDMVKNLLSKMPKESDMVATVKVPELLQSVDNCMAVVEDGSELQIRSNGRDKVRLQINSNFGSIEDTIEAQVKAYKLDKKESFKVDPNLVADLLSLVPDKVAILEFIADKYMFTKVKDGGAALFYMCSLL